MKFSTRFASIALALAAVASQSQAANFSLGTLTSSGTTFGNTFYSDVASFTDYYTFTIANPGTVSGTTTDTSWMILISKDVTLNSLTLTSSTSAAILAQDSTPSSFTFAGLGAGDYKLAVQGSVSGLMAASGNYSGTIKAVAVTAPVASAAPEPADLALTLVGLAGVGFLVRRRAAR
jgi:hypothetical protein